MAVSGVCGVDGGGEAREARGVKRQLDGRAAAFHKGLHLVLQVLCPPSYTPRNSQEHPHNS